MDVKKLRKSTGLNQHDFWKCVFITQSGGSRYENEARGLPKTVRALLTIAYGDHRAAGHMWYRLRGK